jgi:nucleoside-diphosphate-sugar epimerase
MLKCGITGATGVLGKKIIKNLPFKFYKFNKDISKYNEVRNWVNKYKFDLIIHLAAIAPVRKVKKNYKKALRVNVVGTKNLINCILIKKEKPKWFFYSSTSHVYALKKKYKHTAENEILKPQSLYGKTKLIAEKYLLKKLKNQDTLLCIGRIFSFTDKNQKEPFVIPSLINKITKNKYKKINFSNLNHHRDFLSTTLISKIIYRLYKKNKFGIYNIGSGKSLHLEKVAMMLCKKYKKTFAITKTQSPTYLIANIKKISKVYSLPKKKYKNILKYLY